MKISFSILTYNSSKILLKCINAIIDDVNTSKIIYEINVLNNGSSDDTKDVVSNIEGKINYYENIKNMSFTNGFNTLLSKSTGKVFCMLSDDVIISKGTVNHILDYFSKKENQKTIVGPLTKLPSGKLDNIKKKKLREKDFLLGYTFLGSLIKRKNTQLDQTKRDYCDILQSSCLFFHNEIKSKYILDEDFKFYFSEDALSIKLDSYDCKFLYETDINVFHFHKYATKKIKNVKTNTIYTKDSITYSRKFLNPYFHYLIFMPLNRITYLLKYIKWLLNPSHYV